MIPSHDKVLKAFLTYIEVGQLSDRLDKLGDRLTYLVAGLSDEEMEAYANLSALYDKTEGF